jgi:Uma2 family endonuclease
MNEPARKLSYTFADYVALEAKSAVKHELVNGQVFAMAGGTPEHGRLSVNVQAELRDALRGRRCNVFNADVRVRVPATGLTTYPDASVVCTRLELDPEDKNTIYDDPLAAPPPPEPRPVRARKAARRRRV